ncbi:MULTISPECIES: SpoIIE family protein phosphatase [Streptomycetaceae]|uniref:Magnesium or manganese-dependent protein phosphatase n=1 Tax=Streptantibioticus cattleyicolor (strain ATCC 35852 / DSM 46488 / JCM 4925 / NBRC 14057 / NRRL 8057) TaxID=1003195 RepID=F8K3R9_STREN|nr:MULTISPECIES: SpoIIE family protein phosphatase [Streptomycetaceae]AEW97608.1 magnesium or manganese-dependent protein phosphatase [Streptantibioticus cattleyicolor NRRL 8057 = DSM 46488]MYS62037.1 SpoIIE family protein phosphatase [Streptomyces sp. SID5468]CCB77930.1 Magnesium or manganese-dependent protein phosphatase [Streptantibioticus cattleyicolor NRRL 8057 = DSM 46488]
MSRVWDIPVQDSTRTRDVRVAAEDACGHAGLDAHATAATALVATELATNLVKHANGGRIVINLTAPCDTLAEAAPCVQITSLDHGPGIGDVPTALRDGYTTAASSLGAGLGTCRRIATDFDLHSRTGAGTVAVARTSPARPPGTTSRPVRSRPGTRAGGITTALAYAEHSGDAFAWVRSGPTVTLMLTDGLGHGAKAAEASAAAVRELRGNAGLPPADILRHLHTALRGTRGAAVGVAQLDEDTNRLSFAGVGNIGARLRTGDGWRPLISHPGIVGAHFPATVPVQRSPWRTESLLVLHSDGLPGRWVPPDDPGLVSHDPAVTAAVVLRDAGSAARPLRDDTTVAVLAPDPPDGRP